MRPPAPPSGRAAWRLAFALPALLCLLFMLPRLASAQFGLFDDGRTLFTVEGVRQGAWDMSIDETEGRFRPMYWLYPALVYALAGEAPAAFFAGNLLVFAGTALLVVAIARARRAGPLEAGLAGALFALAVPAAESYYTLSKGEPIQTFWLAAALLALAAGRAGESRGRRAARALAIALALLLAMLSKETSLAVVPVGAAWAALAWAGRRTDRARGVERLLFLLAALVAAAAFLALRAAALPVGLAGGSYTGNYELSAGRLADSLVQWAGWLARDVPHLAPLGLAFLALSLRPGAGALRAEGAEDLVWMAAWVGVYLPWHYAADYYLLPFALAAALFSARIGVSAARAAAQARGLPRAAWRALVLAAALLWAATLGTLATNARVQLTVDRQNAAALAFLAESLPPGSALVVNIQAPNEYYYEIEILLRTLYRRPDVVVAPFRFQSLGPGEAGRPPDYVLVGRIAHQPRLTVRMGVVEATLADWNRTLEGALAGRGRVVYDSLGGFRMLHLNLPRLFCPLAPDIAYCAASGEGLLERRRFEYGWRVLEIGAP